MVRDNWWQPNLEMFSLPNGDLYFQDYENDAGIEQGGRLSVRPYRFRYLEASSGQIKSYKITNVPNTQNISNANDCQLREFAITFNPATSAIGERIAAIREHPGFATVFRRIWVSWFESMQVVWAWHPIYLRRPVMFFRMHLSIGQRSRVKFMLGVNLVVLMESIGTIRSRQELGPAS